MKKSNVLIGFIVLTIIASSCGQSLTDRKDARFEAFLSSEIVDKTIAELKNNHDENNHERIERGVKQIAVLWNKDDGSPEEFKNFCIENFIPEGDELDLVYERLERNFEIILGSFNYITVRLWKPVHLTEFGDMHPVDMMFASYSVFSHLAEDFFNNKIAFYTALNFPAYSLAEKAEYADEWDRRDWAFARMGDAYTSRVPAELNQKASAARSQASSYIDNYNIYMGKLINENEETIFPENMVLISHWGLRDELKSNYNSGEEGFNKKIMIYEVMKRIIRQEIPMEVINSGDFKWNPFTNTVYDNGEEVEFTPEGSRRFEKMLNQFKARYAMDAYNPVYPTFLERAYDGTKELSMDEVEELFVNFISAPEIKEVAALIQKRLGRDLEPFDIWYDGFKSRAALNEEELDEITKRKYPNAEAYNDDIPRMLMDLGWNREDAEFLASKIVVEGSRGAGHAYGAQMKDDVVHLRTRIGQDGMDYKGYNIAMHELGHNVEQVITLHMVDYYMLRSVPNTAFTEAIAFMFQSRDLDLLGYDFDMPQEEVEALAALDNCWSSFEIMGVSLVDMYLWQWLYENPNATPEELRDQLEKTAIEVWNEYYAPVFGIKDSPILGIYSHMITSPLYLANYPLGKLIQFQIENHIQDYQIADEVTRMLVQGNIIPQEWMMGAVGNEISGQPTLKAVRKALEVFND